MDQKQIKVQRQILGSKQFWVQKIHGSEIILVQIFIGPTKIGSIKILAPKYVLGPTEFFWSENNVALKMFGGFKWNFWSGKI